MEAEREAERQAKIIPTTVVALVRLVEKSATKL